ncbi:MAG TPA: DNA repair protein RadA [Patescibacteria group bacterium]|nr:DNA repair protein RadA [Patescibacteria group bacterium]
MPKSHSLFVCQQCGYESAKWLGKCPNCSSWNSFVETVEKTSIKSSHASSNAKPVNLSEYSTKDIARVSTKISELDRALGGGIVIGQVILLAGVPGIGKSTLLLQLANNLQNVLYVSGEESVNQIALRAKRLKINNNNLQILETTNIDDVIDSGNSLKDLDLIIVDSIQTMATSDLSGMAGSVGQVRECAFRLVRLAKSNNIPIFIVGHVTKQGSVAGPQVLAHIVDTVLWFEGDKSLTLRLIRATKNRFGPADEVGVFEMKESGLISLDNPEKLFLSDENLKAPGIVTSAIIQGSRPILVEIESLVTPSKLPFPKRIASGVDAKRFEILLAVLIKNLNIPLYEYDCFVNVGGGISAKTPSIDLAICLSIISSFYNKQIPKNILAVGEVGLLGDIRKVLGEEKINKLSKSLGFKETPKVRTIKELIKTIGMK